MINYRIPAKLRKPLIWLVAIVGFVVVLRLTVFAPVQIKTVTIVKHDLTAQVYGNGTVEAKVVVPVSSKVTGRIEALYADQGDTVKSGQVLVRFEDEDYHQQVLEAEAGVRKAEAAFIAGNADNQKAQANLELAQKTFARMKAMGDKNLVSQQNVDEQSAVLTVAQKEVEHAAAVVDVANKDYQAAEASLALAQSRKNDMTVMAPNNGIIISRDLEKGSMVPPGLPIFRLADPTIIWVTAYVDESRCQDLAIGQSALIYLRSAPKKVFNGHVARIDLESDRVTEELEVNIAIDPPLPPFRIGEQTEVYITTALKKEAQALPAGTVTSKGKQRHVWAVKNGKLKSQEVVTGIEDRSGFIEILSGIDNDTHVAIAPPPVMMSFKDGMRVKVMR
ncbi:MAG TPA: efflux RND transporter periplasmic adaptor subunit [candidate division Zixibacteria bacterium]|jgi:HlyD family secretion protein|nr:efflux RND transporter periplasmic adaptor subunit [candidate division Zixibacteria bacterium]HBZ01957.1 efflux RND transporter periplasmic adaptor subunit [candidate division Zixibacteria bacterium]